MIHTLSNDFLSVQIKQTGAELCSLFSLASGTEYIWQADAHYWANHAPLLFPVIGELIEGRYAYNNAMYQMPKHGFLRNNPDFMCTEKTATSITFSLRSNAQTLTMYPFHFVFSTTYSIERSTLIQSFTIENSGSETLYFSLGAHPAFNCPFLPGEHYSDYYLEFQKNEFQVPYKLNSQGLVGPQRFEPLIQGRQLPLSNDLFARDALIFKQIQSQSVSLKCRKHSRQLRVDFPGFPYLGIWAKTGAPFVCIEPWMGVADTYDHNGYLQQKEGIRSLSPHKSTSANISISIDEGRNG